METYRKDELSVMVGKIWIIDENKDTVKIKESIQGKLCRIFSNHKVSYNNNIFYVSSTLYEQGETVEDVGSHQKAGQLDRTGRDYLQHAGNQDEDHRQQL